MKKNRFKNDLIDFKKYLTYHMLFPQLTTDSRHCESMKRYGDKLAKTIQSLANTARCVYISEWFFPCGLKINLQV